VITGLNVQKQKRHTVILSISTALCAPFRREETGLVSW